MFAGRKGTPHERMPKSTNAVPNLPGPEGEIALRKF